MMEYLDLLLALYKLCPQGYLGLLVAVIVEYMCLSPFGRLHPSEANSHRFVCSSAFTTWIPNVGSGLARADF